MDDRFRRQSNLNDLLRRWHLYGILALLLCGAFVAKVVADECPCTIAFTSPDDHEEYPPGSSIGCVGTSSGTTGNSVRIRVLRIVNEQVHIQDEEVVNTSSTGGWNHTFSPPPGGWPESVQKIEAQFFQGDGSPGGMPAEVNISIREMGGGGGS